MKVTVCALITGVVVFATLTGNAAKAADQLQQQSALRAGQAPKPGLISCAGKFEGRYEPAGGGPGPRIVFRSGKATVREPDVVMKDGKVSALFSEKEAECWTGGKKNLSPLARRIQL